jgi:hypothetical protein
MALPDEYLIDIVFLPALFPFTRNAKYAKHQENASSYFSKKILATTQERNREMLLDRSTLNLLASRLFFHYNQFINSLKSVGLFLSVGILVLKNHNFES